MSPMRSPIDANSNRDPITYDGEVAFQPAWIAQMAVVIENETDELPCVLVRLISSSVHDELFA